MELYTLYLVAAPKRENTHTWWLSRMKSVDLRSLRAQATCRIRVEPDEWYALCIRKEVLGVLHDKSRVIRYLFQIPLEIPRDGLTAVIRIYPVAVQRVALELRINMHNDLVVWAFAFDVIDNGVVVFHQLLVVEGSLVCKRVLQIFGGNCKRQDKKQSAKEAFLPT